MNTKFSNYLMYAFAVIGFISVLSSFNNQEKQEVHGTPESHVWDIYQMDTGETHYNWLLNKQTGQVWSLKKKGTMELVVPQNK